MWQVGSFLEDVYDIVGACVCQVHLFEVVLDLQDAGSKSLMVVCYPLGEGVVDKNDVIECYQTVKRRY